MTFCVADLLWIYFNWCSLHFLKTLNDSSIALSQTLLCCHSCFACYCNIGQCKSSTMCQVCLLNPVTIHCKLNASYLVLILVSGDVRIEMYINSGLILLWVVEAYNSGDNLNSAVLTYCEFEILHLESSRAKIYLVLLNAVTMLVLCFCVNDACIFYILRMSNVGATMNQTFGIL